MGDPRQVFRWALPGWFFFLSVAAFEMISRVTSGAVGEYYGGVKLPDKLAAQFPDLTPIAITVLFAAAGIPLGFLLWQVDSLVAALGVPLSTGHPDSGWRLVRFVPHVLLDRWASEMWLYLHPDQELARETERRVWRRPAQPLRAEPLGPLTGGLWSALGFMWSSGRRYWNVRTQFHAELAEALWNASTSDTVHSRLAARTLDLADREKAIGSCRAAAVGAYLFLFGAEALVADPALALVAILVAALGPIALVLVWLAIRGLDATVWASLLFLSQVIVAASLVFRVSPDPIASLLLAGVLIVQLVVAIVLGLRWSARYRKRVSQMAVHIVGLATVAAAAFWWIPWNRPVLSVLGISFIPCLVLLLLLVRILNVNQRLIRQRRLALQTLHLTRQDWTSFFGVSTRAIVVDNVPVGRATETGLTP